MRLFVPLTRPEFDALLSLARAERRRPQDQAAILLARTLAANAVPAGDAPQKLEGIGDRFYDSASTERVDGRPL